jgi:hypothetical protein
VAPSPKVVALSRQQIAEEVVRMRLPRTDIVDRLANNGDMASAHQAEATLPEEVDTERDHALLKQCGVDVNYLFKEQP